MPKISVVIPSYNHALYISAAIQSVLMQSLSDLELIIVDDGSQDDSVKIVQAMHDPRIRLVVQENRGAHAAINRGLEICTSDYCTVLNSDDCYHPTRLERLVDVLERNPDIGLIGSYIEIIDPQGTVAGVKQGYRNMEPWLLPDPQRSFRAGSDLRAVLLTENYLATTSNFVFRRELYQSIGGFRPLRYTHDWDFALRVASQCRIELVPEALMQYRIHPTNTIRENHAAMIFEICWCLAMHLPQYLADQPLLAHVSDSQRVEKLLHSIYTYENEKVLSVLLAHNLHLNVQAALVLLDPQNESRQIFINFIRERITATVPASSMGLVSRFVQSFVQIGSRIKKIL